MSLFSKSTTEDSSVRPHAQCPPPASALNQSPARIAPAKLERGQHDGMRRTTRRRLALGIGARTLESDDDSSEDDVASLPPSATSSMDHDDELSGVPTR